MTLALSPSASLAPSASGGVRLVLRAEGLMLLGVATLIHAWAGFSWIQFVGLFLAPDLSLAAYAFGPIWGAAAYNAAHATLAPLALAAAALALHWTLGEALALIWLAHVGFDRALGYGLKYGSAFADTHLGRIGRP